MKQYVINLEAIEACVREKQSALASGYKQWRTVETPPSPSQPSPVDLRLFQPRARQTLPGRVVTGGRNLFPTHGLNELKFSNDMISFYG